MKAVKVQADGSVRLPLEVRRRFPSRSELLVWTEGDTIVLKRVRPVRATEIAERAPARKVSLRGIAAEVHRMRRAKRGTGA
jgi:bifunctional DNA-binding transcriptional regulator/antitoxin component of YhaV-PrlF toxin-antitoxin module